MKPFLSLCLLLVILSLCLLSNAETIENEQFSQLTRQEMIQMRRGTFFKRIIQQSEAYFDRKTGLNEDLGRLISIKEKITGVLTQFKLKFLSNKGFHEVQVSAIESQDIINFVSLTEEEFKQEKPQDQPNLDQRF